MRRAIVVCKALEAEMRSLLPPGVELRAMEQGLHRTPENLRTRLQQEIDSLDADEILLGYGLCGNGLAGLRSSNSRLIVPRADDCISILLGSVDRYREEVQREPGTYWLSHGWIEHSRDPYKEYQRCLEKWGEETARWVAGEMMKSYRRLVLIDTGACPVEQLRGYARQFAGFFQIDYQELPGSGALLRSLLASEPGNGELVVVEPGQKITTEMFVPALAAINL